MSDVIGKTCPYCQTPIKPGESVVFCTSCSIPHHQECWNDGRGCTTFGCNGHPATEPSNRYGRNNTMVVDIDANDSNAQFCSNCGSPINDQAVYCSRCGMRIGDIATRELYTPAPGPQNYPDIDNSPNIENEKNENSSDASNNDSASTNIKVTRNILLRKPWLFVSLVVLIIISVVYFNIEYSDNPEVAVKTFYHAYFQSDYETMELNLSVFWGVQFMPQYMQMSPQELLENRPAIEKSMMEFITQMESENKVLDNMDIKILPKYTQRADNTALVAYEFREQNKSVGMEMALLVKEDNRMRILKMMPVDQEQLDRLTVNDIAEMEKNFNKMLER